LRNTQIHPDPRPAILADRQAIEEIVRHVMAHAYTPRAIRRAIECGVRCIEHGNLVNEATARLMVERNVYMVPTLATLDHLLSHGPALGFRPSRWKRSTRPGLSVAKH
jgi:hypothetical protein